MSKHHPSMKKHIAPLLVLLAWLCAGGAHAQYATASVTLESEAGDMLTFLGVCTAQKSGDAVKEAVEGTFNTILTQGVEGLHNGRPMITGDTRSFLYRFFNEKLYNRFLVGKPQKVSDKKINGVKQVTVRLTVNMRMLLTTVKGGGVTLNPAWADAKEVKATSALNPTIVVVPYVKGDGDDSFGAMKAVTDASPIRAHAVNEVSSLFARHGYKTRDFRTALSNSKTSAVLNEDTQDDLRSMVVRQLPGDIVVTVEVDVVTDGGHKGSCALNIRAVEQQTENTLASVSFASGTYMTVDSMMLVNNALQKSGDKFFTEMQAAFERMVAQGRAMTIEFNLGAEVTDWDFDQPAPATERDFREDLENWLSDNSFQGVYKMDNSTDKYILASINIPIWDSENNRGYTVSRFAAKLKKFLLAEFDEMYKPEITSMGQKLLITIK